MFRGGLETVFLSSVDINIYPHVVDGIVATNDDRNGDPMGVSASTLSVRVFHMVLLAVAGSGTGESSSAVLYLRISILISS